MNGKPVREPHYEMRWHPVVAVDPPKRRCPQMVMKWISVTALNARLSN